MKLGQLLKCYFGQIRIYSSDGILLYNSRNNILTPSDNLLSKDVWDFIVDDEGLGLDVSLTDAMYYDGELTGNFEEVR